MQQSNRSFVLNKMTAIFADFCFLLASFSADSSTNSGNSKTSMYYSIAELTTALDMASPGDQLFLANGRYNFSASLLIKADGISLSAQTSGGVLFTGGKVNIKIKGNGNTIAGFQFISGQSYEKGNVIDVFGDHNTLIDLNFDGYSAKKYLSIRAGSQYNTIERCNFQNKPKHSHQGNLVEVQADKVEPGYHVIRLCSFQKMKEGKGGDNGNEPIRIGEGEQAGYVSRTVIEFNVFNNTGLADSESISVKAEENIIRYNTFADQQNAVLSFRNGNYNVAYGNFFLSSGGIRIREASHIAVYNNYFENSGDGKHYYPIDLGDVSEFEGNDAYQVDLSFQFNTFINSASIYLGSKYNKITNLWANNIFHKDPTVAKGNVFEGISVGDQWISNLVSGGAPLGIKYYLGLTATTNVLLERNPLGFYGLSTNSPARGAANASSPLLLDIPVLDDDPTVSLDITGRMRPSLISQKDLGCSQYFASDSSSTTITTATPPPAATATITATLISVDSTVANTVTATTDGITSLHTTTIEDDDDIHHAINRPLHIDDVGPMYLRKGIAAGLGIASFSPTYEPTLPPSAILPTTLRPVGQPSSPTLSPSSSLIDGSGSSEEILGGNVTHTAAARGVHRTDIIPVGLDTSEVTKLILGVIIISLSMGILWLSWYVYKRWTAPPGTFQALTEDDSDHESGGSGLDREKGTIEVAGMVTREHRMMVRDGENDSGDVVEGIHLNTLSSIGRSQHVTANNDDTQSTNGEHFKHTESINNSLLRASSNDSADGTASDRSTTNLIVTDTNQHLITSVNKTPIKAIKPPPPPPPTV